MFSDSCSYIVVSKGRFSRVSKFVKDLGFMFNKFLLRLGGLCVFFFSTKGYGSSPKPNWFN